jgi:hypothetical protein
VKSSYIREGEEDMKRILFIILAVVVTVFLLIGLSFAGMASQRSQA